MEPSLKFQGETPRQIIEILQSKFPSQVKNLSEHIQPATAMRAGPGFIHHK